MLHRASIHRRRWQRAAFAFVLGVGAYVAGSSVFVQSAFAQFGAPSTMVGSQIPGTAPQQTPADPSQQPATIRRVPVSPSTPLAAPVSEPSAPLLDPAVRNQIIERHSEQMKSQGCARKLEQRRRALHQLGHSGYRYPRQ